MPTFRVVSVLTVMVVCLFLWEECCAQNNARRGQRNRNPVRTTDGMPPNIREAYHNAFDGHNTPPTESTTVTAGWSGLAPSTPASNNVECHVEIYTLRRIGGRCTRLGGLRRPYICQGGAHFEFNSDCERIVRNRLMANDPQK